MSSLISKWCSFKGRINRKEFIFRLLVVSTLSYFIGFGFGFVFGFMGYSFPPLLAILLMICSTPFFLSFCILRLHDLNKSGLWSIFGIIPVVCLLIYVPLVFFKGTDGPNKYGQDPLAIESNEELLS